MKLHYGATVALNAAIRTEEFRYLTDPTPLMYRVASGHFFDVSLFRSHRIEILTGIYWPPRWRDLDISADSDHLLVGKVLRYHTNSNL